MFFQMTLAIKFDQMLPSTTGIYIYMYILYIYKHAVAGKLPSRKPLKRDERSKSSFAASIGGDLHRSITCKTAFNRICGDGVILVSPVNQEFATISYLVLDGLLQLYPQHQSQTMILAGPFKKGM